MGIFIDRFWLKKQINGDMETVQRNHKKIRSLMLETKIKNCDSIQDF